MKLSHAFIALVLLISFYSGCKKEQPVDHLPDTTVSGVSESISNRNDSTISYYLVSGRYMDTCSNPSVPSDYCFNDYGNIVNETIMVVRNHLTIRISNSGGGFDASFSINDSVIVNSTTRSYSALNTTQSGGVSGGYETVYFYTTHPDSISLDYNYSQSSYFNASSYTQSGYSWLSGNKIH